MIDTLFNILLILIIAIFIIIFAALLICAFFAAISFIGTCYRSWKDGKGGERDRSSR